MGDGEVGALTVRELRQVLTDVSRKLEQKGASRSTYPLDAEYILRAEKAVDAARQLLYQCEMQDE